MTRKFVAKKVFVVMLAVFLVSNQLYLQAGSRKEKIDKDLQDLQEKFQWWPTDAAPGPVKDEKSGGYWWWPATPGKMKPWGNRGYIYVHKIIFDYKAEELPPPQPKELRPSLLVKKIHKNIKIYFDYDSSVLRGDGKKILEQAVRTLKKNPQADILITGNCDARGSEGYNLELGKNRALAVKNFMLECGIPEQRVRIISRGKLDAIAPLNDLVGMQKDRNAHFVIAEVEEIMIPYPEDGEIPEAKPLEEGKYLIEKQEEVESQVKVSMRAYTIQKNDTLWKIAAQQLGDGHRWKYLYEFNNDIIDNPNKLKAGTVINIPVEKEAQISDSEQMLFESETGESNKEISIPALPEIEDEELKPRNTLTKGTASTPSSSSVRKYTVKKNDSLWKIAKQQLGDGNRWKEIYELNKSIIKKPDKLIAGQVISIPEN